MQIPIKKLYPEAVLPTYAHIGDAGMDLYTRAQVEVLAGQRALIGVGVAMAIPSGYVGLIWDKSGLSNKSGLKVLGGVVDAGYRGEIMVGILNTSNETFIFEIGQKVAQMLIQKVESPELIEVSDLENTERGEGAFGSTGV